MDPFEYMHGLPKPEARDYSGLGAESISAADDRAVRAAAARARGCRVGSRRCSTCAVSTAAGSSPRRATGCSSRGGSPGPSQVWRQDGPQKWPVQLTGGEDNTTVVGIAPDDSFVVVSRDVGGAENPGLYVLDPKGGALRVIQHTPKVQTSLALISDDAKSIYYRANDRDPASYAIYRFDVATRGRSSSCSIGRACGRSIDQRGDQWLLQKQIGELQSEIYQWDTTKQTLTPILGQGEAEDYEARFGAKPGQLIVRTDKLGEFARLYTFEGGKLAPIGAEIQHDVEAFAIDAARTRIYYNINEDGYRRLVALDAKTLRSRSRCRRCRPPILGDARGRDPQRAIRAVRAQRIDRVADDVRLRLADQEAGRVAQPGVAGDRRDDVREGRARVVSGARRRRDSDVRATAGEVREVRVPGDRRVSRWARGSGHSRCSHRSSRCSSSAGS